MNPSAAIKAQRLYLMSERPAAASFCVYLPSVKDLRCFSSYSLWEEQEQTGIMSRRSLRLDEGLLDRSLPHSSASFSVGGGSWRSSRSLKSRCPPALSSSCSESLLLGQTPRKGVGPPLLNSSLHSVTSDASLLSSLLDTSSVQENTLVDTFWGLDYDVDPKESTVLAAPGSVPAGSRSLIGSDSSSVKQPVQTPSRVYCKDCEPVSSITSPSSKYTSCSSKYTSCSSRTAPGRSEPRDQETSTVYCRDRSHKSRTDVLQLWLDSSVLCVRRAAACCGSLLTHSWQQVCRGLSSKVNTHAARFSRCGDMKERRPNGSLCKTAGEAFRWLSRRWRHMTTSFLLTRFPLRLFLALVPLLLLFSLCWFGPAALQSVLPAVNITEWRTAVSEVSGLSSVYLSTRSAGGGAAEEEKEAQSFTEPLRPAATHTAEEEEAAAGDDSGRLALLERSLTALWERVEAGGQREEQRHREMLHLYTDLQQLSSQQQRGDVEPWLSGLMDQQMSDISSRLDEERRQRERDRQQDSMQHQSQTSRLDQLELQLQTLAANTEQVHRRQEAELSPTTLPAAVSVGVDRPSHDALLAEVSRLEAALQDVRRDVDGLSDCRRTERLERLEGLEGLEQTVSAQVQEAFQLLVYGNQEVGGASSESLLHWLSQHYVSGVDLQEALSSLELRILQNVSLQLQQRGSEETIREAGLQISGATGASGASGAAVTQEDVQQIVNSALRLFSEDRTGRADYALESGGGSVLSTRCSETYETKAALLSLFGLPLWYFSQSPRAVIQPDVHPGNCWAFRGSTGFLVIRLSMRILPSAFSLEHIPKNLAPSRTLHSAPRDFSVYGLDDERQEKGKLLGSFTYDEDGEALQTYSVTEENEQTFQIIEVQVLSNWGHPEYTCMYRFRVHGTPHS
ncbi:uncharacterized protein LOC128381804 [Scomber scombrus]|uniref:Uncharacterized protein LOC128381804 n=2 Tax=Scomber scombrus TaxID=13677 RepID=A0AAV1QGE4_SCOSC